MGSIVMTWGAAFTTPPAALMLICRLGLATVGAWSACALRRVATSAWARLRRANAIVCVGEGYVQVLGSPRQLAKIDPLAVFEGWRSL